MRFAKTKVPVGTTVEGTADGDTEEGTVGEIGLKLGTIPGVAVTEMSDGETLGPILAGEMMAEFDG